MTSLTAMIANRQSPVSQWMRERFPDATPLLREVRNHAGAIAIEPPEGTALGTQGAAIDWWIRFLLAPGMPGLKTAVKGLDRLEGLPAYEAAKPMFMSVTGMSVNGTSSTTFDQPLHPLRDLNRHDDEFQARTCYALALLTEFYRASIANSRLLSITNGRRPQELLDLATPGEVTDLIAMRDSARRIFLPRLPKGRVHTGPTFEGSRDLAADADLIAGGTLIELKSTRGGRARADGTRPPRIEPDDLHQLIGYVLMDYSDAYAIDEVGLYLIRYEYFVTWPVDWFLASAAGRHVDLAQTRKEFRDLLRRDAPPPPESGPES